MRIKLVVEIKTWRRLPIGQTLLWVSNLYQLSLDTIIPKKAFEIGAIVTFILQMRKLSSVLLFIIIMLFIFYNEGTFHEKCVKIILTMRNIK